MNIRFIAVAIGLLVAVLLLLRIPQAMLFPAHQYDEHKKEQKQYSEQDVRSRAKTIVYELRVLLEKMYSSRFRIGDTKPDDSAVEVDKTVVAKEAREKSEKILTEKMDEGRADYAHLGVKDKAIFKEQVEENVEYLLSFYKGRGMNGNGNKGSVEELYYRYYQLAEKYLPQFCDSLK